MSNIEIPSAKLEQAEILRALSVSAFEENFKKYGHYPPGLESLDWHKDKIRNDIYHAIQYEKEIVGGVHMVPHPNNEMKIEFLFIHPKYQGLKIGTNVMTLIEKKYKSITKWFLHTPYKDYGNHYFYEKLGYVKVDEIQPLDNSDFTLFQYDKILKTVPDD